MSEQKNKGEEMEVNTSLKISRSKRRERQIMRVRRWFIARDQTDAEKRGAESERRFEVMTRWLIQYGWLGWAQGIARVSSEEDLVQHTDFRIRAVEVLQRGFKSEFSIYIQVKSSDYEKTKLTRKNGTPIYTVVMYPDMKLANLKRTLNLIYEKERMRHR